MKVVEMLNHPDTVSSTQVYDDGTKVHMTEGGTYTIVHSNGQIDTVQWDYTWDAEHLNTGNPYIDNLAEFGDVPEREMTQAEIDEYEQAISR